MKISNQTKGSNGKHKQCIRNVELKNSYCVSRGMEGNYNLISYYKQLKLCTSS